MTVAEVDPHLCSRALKGDTTCAMDKDHRGRCSSVAFVCDLCGKRRRGQPKIYDVGEDDRFAVCFMCDVVERPDPADYHY